MENLSINELLLILEEYSQELETELDEFYTTEKEFTIDSVTKFLKYVQQKYK